MQFMKKYIFLSGFLGILLMAGLAGGPVSADTPSRTRVEGTLILMHVEYADGTGSPDQFYLKTTDAAGIYTLSFATPPDISLANAKVAVSGVVSGSTITMDATAPAMEVLTPAPAMTTTGNHRTLVLPINFQNDKSQPITQAALQSTMFGATKSVNAYYRENSFNKTWFTGDVLNWITIPYDKPSSGCSLASGVFVPFEQAAKQEAIKRGYNPDIYMRIVYVYVQMAACDWVAYGELGGRMSGYNGPSHMDYYAHEFGHNLNAHHANFLDCGTIAIGPSSSCTNKEYGDYSDVMGGGFEKQFNGPHKFAMNWVSTANVR